MRNAASDSSQSDRCVLLAVTTSHLFNHLSMTVMSFLIPTLVAKELGLDTVQVGLLSATAQLTSGISQLFWALLSNFLRKNFIMGLGNALQAISGAIAVAVKGFTDVLTLRFLWGIGSAPQHPVASSLISENYHAERRGLALSIHMGFAYIGNMVGPLMATYLAMNFGWRMAFLLIGLPQLVLAAFFFGMMRNEPHPMASQRISQNERMIILRHTLKSLLNPDLLLVNVSQVLVTAGRGLNLWITYLPMYLVQVKRFDIETSALMVSAFLAAGTVGTLLFGYLGNPTQKLLLASLSTLFTSLSLIYLGVIGLSGFPLILMLIAIGFVSLEVVVSLQSYLAEISDNTYRNMAFGVFFTLGFVAASFWTTVIGYVIQRYGFNTAFILMGCVSLPAAIAMNVLRLLQRKPAYSNH
jgi:FSR family fosmidomycin resistance protein-like MFS transporter